MRELIEGRLVNNTSSLKNQELARIKLDATEAKRKQDLQQEALRTERMSERAKNQKLISEQEAQLSEKTEQLKTQSEVNAHQAQLLKGYQTQEETSRKADLVKDLMQGLNTKEQSIVTQALKELNTKGTKPSSFITFSDNNNFDNQQKPESYKLDLSVNTIAKDLTGGNLPLAEKLVRFILAYNNLPATKLDGKEDGSPVYEFEQRRDTQPKNNFSLGNVAFNLPELTEGEKFKGSPVISLDGVPYLNDAQKQEQIEQRKTVLQQIIDRILPPVAGLLIGVGGGGVVGINSISENPLKGVPDLLPNYPEQFSVSLNKPPLAISKTEKSELSRADLFKMRDLYFQKVAVQAGDGYTQLMERYLAADLKKLGTDKITPNDRQLAVAVNLSQAMTNLDHSTNPNVDLRGLTNPNLIEKLPYGITEAYIPKQGVLPDLIKGEIPTTGNH